MPNELAVWQNWMPRTPSHAASSTSILSTDGYLTEPVAKARIHIEPKRIDDVSPRGGHAATVDLSTDQTTDLMSLRIVPVILKNDD